MKERGRVGQPRHAAQLVSNTLLPFTNTLLSCNESNRKQRSLQPCTWQWVAIVWMASALVFSCYLEDFDLMLGEPDALLSLLAGMHVQMQLRPSQLQPGPITRQRSNKASSRNSRKGATNEP